MANVELSNDDRMMEADLVSALSTSLVSQNENFDPFAIGDQVRLDLHFRWIRATSNLGRPDVCLQWFERIYQQHNEQGRHYHTAMHLQEMLQYLDLHLQYNTRPILSLSPMEKQALVLATFFHDLIYDVNSATNEEESAASFQQFMKQVGDTGLCKWRDEMEHFVVRCILATKQHKVSVDNAISLSLFLDLDMAVLGKSPSAYLSYASLIRKEYIHVKYDVYCEKRAEVLEDFLKHTQIFGTNAMLEVFEQQARDNIAKEIAILRSGKIPGEEQSLFG